MKIKFNDSERMYDIESFRYRRNLDIIIIKGGDLPEKNDSGFIIFYQDNDSNDYTDYKYKWNVLTDLESGIMMLTNNPDNIETEDNLAESYFPKPISKEEMIELQRQTLLQAKAAKVQESKDKLSEYLSKNPLISTAHGGKEGIYSVTMEKQSLMMSQYMTYQVEKAVNPDAKLTWNETGEECEEWKEEEFLRLILEVKQYVYPLVSYQQRIEKEINACTTDEELAAVVIDYSLFEGKEDSDEADM